MQVESAASGNTDFTSFATGDVSDVEVPVRVNIVWKRLTYFGMRLNRIRGQEVKGHTGSENKCGDGLCVCV